MKKISNTIKGIWEWIKTFLSDKFNAGLVSVLFLVGIYLLITQPGPVKEIGNGNVSVHYFYLPTCPHCHEQLPIINELQADYPNVTFVYHDVSRQEELLFFMEMANERGLNTQMLGTPTTIIGDKAYVGVYPKDVLEAQLRSCIEACNIEGGTTKTKPDVTNYELPFIGKTNLLNYSLPVLSVILGLIDGFNPCAMWVLVYLIAVVAQLNDKTRIWLIVGSFLFASGALYFLFMTAWLNAFLLLGYMRSVTILIGLFAVGGGVLGIKEFIETKGRVVCKVGDEESKKSTMRKINELASAPLTYATVLGIVMLAFIVNSVEFVCSSAIPAVFTQVLALSKISTLEHYLYISLYDFFYMLDDMIIFSMAAFAVASGGIGEKYAGYCKVFGGSILFLLGLMLLFAPNMLA